MMIQSRSCSYWIAIAIATILLLPCQVAYADCVADPQINDFFAVLNNNASSLPVEGSCCMQDVCGLECPVPVPKPGKGTCSVYVAAVCKQHDICSVFVRYK
jgi:hypothetical protein